MARSIIAVALLIGLLLPGLQLHAALPSFEPRSAGAWDVAQPADADAAPVPLYPEVAASAPYLSARAAVLLDAETGTVLFGRNAGERRAPASTTKILTAWLALEFGHLDDEVVVSRRAAATPGSSMGIRAGESYRLIDLLHGLMLPSGNDAAVAIAEHISGSERQFVALMNERARKLGMTGSRFQNPHGLTAPGHQSTALDLALLTRAAMEQPGFGDLGCARMRVVCELGTGRRLQLANTNRLLWSYANVEAGKTGTTSAAGPCLIVVASHQGHRLIAVVLNAPNRFADARRLLEWGFEQFQPVRAGTVGEALVQVAVEDGVQPFVRGILAENVIGVAPRQAISAGKVRLQLDVARQVPAPIRSRQRLGTAVLTVGGQVITTVAIVAERDVSILAPMQRWWRQFRSRLANKKERKESVAAEPSSWGEALIVH